jgi:hypothetical protein
MQAKKMKALSVLSMAVVATMGAKAAHAATLSLYYDNIVDFDPTTDTVVQSYGYGAGNTDGTSYTGPTSINIAQGDILEFGVDAVVTNNVNPDGGKNTGTIVVNAGKTTKTQAVQPTNLGLSTLSITVPSSDITGSILSPVPSGAPTGTFGGQPDYNSTAAINGAGGNAVLPPNSGVGTGPTWTQNTQGDVSPTALVGAGSVGSNFAIFGGNGSVASNTAAGVAALSQFGSATASYPNATDFFDSLSYTATKAGLVTLAPAVHTAGTSYWTNTARGSTSVVSGYIAQEFNQPGDVVGTLPVLIVNVVGTGPTSQAVVSLTSGSGLPPATYGAQVGALHITGGNGSYTHDQVTGLTGPTAYVSAGTFNPANDTEVYGVDVTDANGQATGAELAAVVAAIGGDGKAPASAGIAASDSVSGTNPYGFSTNYNLYLVASPGVDATDFLGLDLSGTNDSNLSGLGFSAVAVVPEPMSLGLLAIGGLGLMSRRSRRKI